MRKHAFAVLLLLCTLPALLVGQGCTTTPPEGVFVCQTSADCPSGWFCHADGYCYSKPEQNSQPEAGASEPEAGVSAPEAGLSGPEAGLSEDAGSASMDSSMDSSVEAGGEDAATANQDAEAAPDAESSAPCSVQNGGCDQRVTCDDTSGSVVCGPCPSGSHGNGKVCEDDDECALGTFTCGAHSTCQNTDPGYACPCLPGYHGDGKTGCRANALCNASGSNCDALASCLDIGGFRYCVCGTGYEGDGTQCSPVNCGTPPSIANGSAQFTSTTYGSVASYRCDSGYHLAAAGERTCQADGTWSGSAPVCEDDDECATDNGGCDSLVQCTNQPGAPPTCGACPTGYVGNGSTGCIPTLTGLALSSGTLSPALSANTLSYTVDVPLATPNISLTPSVPTGASVTIAGQAVAAGQAWNSPPLALGSTAFTLVVSQTGRSSRTYTVAVRRGEPVVLRASDAQASARFGQSVALSADRLAVVGGGSVYVFTRQAQTWQQRAKLSASTGALLESVAMSGDTIVAGAPNAFVSGVNTGQAFVFVRGANEQTWTQAAILSGNNSHDRQRFGDAVAISGDTIAVGVPGRDAYTNQFESGAAFVFVRGAGTQTWTEQAYLRSSHPGEGHHFGKSLALSGDTLVVGAPFDGSIIDANEDFIAGSGAAYVFVRSGTLWSEQAYLRASTRHGGDRFGASVALDGDTLVASAPGESSGVPAAPDNTSAPGSGAVYVFTRASGTWSQRAYLKGSSITTYRAFGASVALSGGQLAVGAEGSTDPGRAYLFQGSGSAWTELYRLEPSGASNGNRVGASVALANDALVIGAPHGAGESNNLAASGAVYLYR